MRLGGDVRHGLQQFRAQSIVRGTLLFALDTFVYTGLFLLLASGSLPLVFHFPAAVFLGFVITRLFIVGHDAAHGSLTGRRILNELIGRLALLPSLHPCSLWQKGHNRVHHSFTNLKGLDFIWTPFSPAEYLALPRGRQRWERIYRSFFGMGAYYLIEIWWKHMLVGGLETAGRERKTFVMDLILTLGFVGSQVAAVCALTLPQGTLPVILWRIVIAVVIPFLAWNWLMAFIIYNHHTHPSVRFYDNRREWRFFESQVKGSVHILFPEPFGLLLNQIMEHTAHHIDVKIPCYQLGAAQHYLEERLKDDLIIQRWSVANFLSTLRRCQLYDYARHEWLTFHNAKEPNDDPNTKSYNY